MSGGGDAVWAQDLFCRKTGVGLCREQVAAGGGAKIKPNTDNSSASVEGASTFYYNFLRNLKLGTRGDDVQALQLFLSNKGFLSTAKNTKLGYFGATTKKALILYQKSVDLKQSGILDADTIGTGFAGLEPRRRGVSSRRSS